MIHVEDAVYKRKVETTTQDNGLEAQHADGSCQDHGDELSGTFPLELDRGKDV